MQGPCACTFGGVWDPRKDEERQSYRLIIKECPAHKQFVKTR